MTTSQITKHFKTEKKRSFVSTEKQNKLAQTIYKKDDLIIDETDSSSKNVSKKKNSRLRKLLVDDEEEYLATKIPKLNTELREIKVPTNSLNTKKVKSQYNDINLKDEVEKLINNDVSINDSTFIKDHKNEIISDKTKEMMKKIKQNTMNDSHIKTNITDKNDQMKEDSMKIDESEKTPKKSNGLSEKTLQMLNKLKNERKNKFLRSPEKEKIRSESSFSLKFRYEELIQDKRQLPLPPNYKNLISQFADFDLTLNFFKVMKKTPIFSDLKHSLENSKGRKFEISIFKKILFIVPHFYILKYEKVQGNEYELLIDFPNDLDQRYTMKYDENFDFHSIQNHNFNERINELTTKELDERKDIFNSLLLKYLISLHSKHLAERGYHYFDPVQHKTWHSSFNLNFLPDIPEFKVVDKPQIKVQTINQLINENDLKSIFIKDAIDNINRQQENITQVNKTQESSGSQAPGLQNILHKAIYEKIKAKEEAINMSKEIIEYTSQKNSKVDKSSQYKKIVLCIRDIFVSKGHATIPFEDLIKYLENINLERAYSKNEIIDILNELLEKLPNFIKCFNSIALGKVVKIDKSIKINELTNLVESISYNS